MPTLTVTEARGKIYQLIDETSANHQPITITGKRNNAVLLSEQDWNAIQETLYLHSIPNMTETIKEGLETPLNECSECIEWQ